MSSCVPFSLRVGISAGLDGTGGTVYVCGGVGNLCGGVGRVLIFRAGGGIGDRRIADGCGLNLTAKGRISDRLMKYGGSVTFLGGGGLFRGGI